MGADWSHFRIMSWCEECRQPFLQLCSTQESLVPQASSCLLLVWNVFTQWRAANSEQVTSGVALASLGADNWFFLPPGSLTQAGLWKNLLLLSVWQTATCLWGFSFQIFDVSVSLPSLQWANLDMLEEGETGCAAAFGCFPPCTGPRGGCLSFDLWAWNCPLADWNGLHLAQNCSQNRVIILEAKMPWKSRNSRVVCPFP